jgi:Fur family ferric uptake transcriptional regulator
MNRSSETLQNTLHAAGQSMTSARRIVFEALLNHEPQTMPQLVASCRGKIDRASVYRTVSLFEHLGIVHRLPHGWKYRLELTDRFQRHHHHITCMHCGRTASIPEDSLLEQRIAAMSKSKGFSVTSHQLELQGICGRCEATHVGTSQK